MKKTFGKKALVVLVIALMGGAFLACGSKGSNPTNTDPDPTPPLNAVVNFKPLAASFPTDIIDFSPNVPLPTGVTYTLTDGQGGSWNSTTFNGQVSAGTRYSGSVTFKQIFYYNGVKIAGGERVVVMDTVPVDGFGFVSIDNDSGTGGITLVHNP